MQCMNMMRDTWLLEGLMGNAVYFVIHVMHLYLDRALIIFIKYSDLYPHVLGLVTTQPYVNTMRYRYLIILLDK